ncbi:hypothetical protein ACFW95_03200 [Streptomyces sp. NPDC059474]
MARPLATGAHATRVRETLGDSRVPRLMFVYFVAIVVAEVCAATALRE